MLNLRYITYLDKTADTKLSSSYNGAVYLYNNGLYLNAKYRFLEFEICRLKPLVHDSQLLIVGM